MSTELVITQGQQKTISARIEKGASLPCQKRCIDLEYLYPDGTPVTGAEYVVASYDGQILYQGKLDQQGQAHITDVPPTLTGFIYYFKDDPKEYTPQQKPTAKPDQQATESMLDTILNWIWGTLQGDFNKDPSTSQIVANTLLGLIPLVDQVLDVRDIIAGLKDIIEYYMEDEAQQKKHEDVLGLSYETWLWVNVFIIAIGCIPEVGSVIKGVLKGLINFLLDASKKAASLQSKQLQTLWQTLVATLNKMGMGNAHTWLKELPSKLDGWMNQAAAKLKAGLDAIRSLLTTVEDYVNKHKSLIELVVDRKTLSEFTAHIQRIKQTLAKVYARLETAKTQVNQWLREQLNKMLEGKHHFEKSGASGTAANQIKNTRVQEVASPKDLPSSLKPGSAEHKAQRWKEYQERTGGKGWKYEHWSKNYDQNMQRAKNSHTAVDSYHKQLGWGKREVTLEVDGEVRRLDIADVTTQRGIEHKTGYQAATAENLSEIARDKKLADQGWDITWVIEGKASKPLLEALKNAEIPYILKP